MLLPARDSHREPAESAQPTSHDPSDNQLPEIVRPAKVSYHAKAISTLQVFTLAVILIAALRILVWPKPLSSDEMKFLGWALGTAVTVLFASNALGRKS